MQMNKFIVEVDNMGFTLWLGGTVWRFSKDRATLHDDTASAQAALDKAKPFMAAKIYRAARIVEAN
jgi:hypothetical protein